MKKKITMKRKEDQSSWVAEYAAAKLWTGSPTPSHVINDIRHSMTAAFLAGIDYQKRNAQEKRKTRSNGTKA